MILFIYRQRKSYSKRDRSFYEVNNNIPKVPSEDFSESNSGFWSVVGILDLNWKTYFKVNEVLPLGFSVRKVECRKKETFPFFLILLSYTRYFVLTILHNTSVQLPVSLYHSWDTKDICDHFYSSYIFFILIICQKHSLECVRYWVPLLDPPVSAGKVL